MAGVEIACDLITAIRDSGAFDGVHLIPVSHSQRPIGAAGQGHGRCWPRGSRWYLSKRPGYSVVRVGTGRWPAARRRRAARPTTARGHHGMLHGPDVDGWPRGSGCRTAAGTPRSPRSPGSSWRHVAHPAGMPGGHHGVGHDGQREQDDAADTAGPTPGSCWSDAETGAGPRQGVAEEQGHGEAGQRPTPGSSPVASRWPARSAPRSSTHSVADSTSEIDRPTSTADRHMGRVRNRSMTPVVRSVLSPTAVPMAEVVRFKASRPARAKSL